MKLSGKLIGPTDQNESLEQARDMLRKVRLEFAALCGKDAWERRYQYQETINELRDTIQAMIDEDPSLCDGPCDESDPCQKHVGRSVAGL